MKSEIITTPAVTKTVVVTPETKEVTLTLTAKEAQHIFDILGGRCGLDSARGATGDASFEHRTWQALNRFLKEALPGHVSEPRMTASGQREVDRNDAFRRSGGY